MLKFVRIKADQLSYFNRITLRRLVYPDRRGRERRPCSGRILKLKILAERKRERDVGKSTIPLVRSWLGSEGECVFPRPQTRHMNKKYPSKLPTLASGGATTYQQLPEPSVRALYIRRNGNRRDSKGRRSCVITTLAAIWPARNLKCRRLILELYSTKSLDLSLLPSNEG